MTRVAAALAAAAALLACAPAGEASGSARVEGPFGRGAAEVWVLRPAGPIRSVVVFGHGWKTSPPSAAAPWVGQFRPWLEHLVAGGSAVVFPRYQLGAGDAQGPERALDYRLGVARGLARLGRPDVPVVAVGYSYGASLAFAYAADARRWQLPTPRAVDCVFPAGPVAGVPLDPLAPSVRVLLQVGDRDVEAGRGGADALWRLLTGHPRARRSYEVVVSRAGLVADHAAPKRSDAAARGAFWQPLDSLVARVRRGR